MKKYTSKMIRWLSKNVPGKCFREATVLFNEKFGTDCTALAIKTACHRSGIKNGKKFPFSEKQEKYIRENYSNMTYKDIAGALNKKYRTSFTRSQISMFCVRKGLSKNHSPITDDIICFIKKIMPIYAAKAAELVNAKFGTSYTKNFILQFMVRHGIKNGLFNSSEICARKRTVYSERIMITTNNGKPYIYIKFQNSGTTKEGCKRDWKKKHLWVWEQAHGPIPDGHTIVFLDNDTLNCALENLCLVNDQVYMNMYFNKLFSNNPEITKTGIVSNAQERYKQTA